MSKLFTVLLLVFITTGAKSQNKDSIAMAREFDTYIKEGQKNFKFFKSIDSLKSINQSLLKENHEKDYQVAEYKYKADNVADNLKLYTFLIKIEKDSLRNLAADTSGYIDNKDSIYTLMLKHDVNLETLKSLVGEAELKSQLPLLYNNIEKGIIGLHFEKEAFPAPPPPPPPPGYGMSLPDWPIGIANSNEDMAQQYVKQEDELYRFCKQNNCGCKYWGLYIKEQSSYKYPQQVMQLIQNQFLFKRFLNKKCSQ